MKRLITNLALMIALTAPLVAQPSAAVEPVSGVAGPNGPLEMWFPNVYDPNHPKLLTFDGFAVSLNTSGQPFPLHLSFDYRDETGQDIYIPVGTFQGPPGVPTPITASLLIPFCPREVSIHFSTEDPAGYQIFGTFTHECIPEPAQIGLLAGLGILGFGMYRRLRQRSKAA